MKKVLMIIAQEGFRDEEYSEPKQVLEAAGITVHTASITTAIAKGKLGMEVQPDLAVKDANISEYEYVILIGGPGAPKLAEYPEVMDVVKNAKHNAAICIAPVILAKAGLLAGKKATVYPDEEAFKIFKENNVEYVKEDVIQDGTTITANGPHAAKKFGEKLVNVIGEEE